MGLSGWFPTGHPREVLLFGTFCPPPPFYLCPVACKVPDVCPLTGFPVKLLPYPPFKLQRHQGQPWLALTATMKQHDSVRSGQSTVQKSMVIKFHGNWDADLSPCNFTTTHFPAQRSDFASLQLRNHPFGSLHSGFLFAGVLRGNTIRGNTTRNSEGKMAL